MGEKGAEAAGPVPGSPGASLFVDSLENSPFSANPQTTGELGAETIPTRAPSPGAVAGLNSLGSAPATDNSDLMNKDRMSAFSPASDASDLMNKDRMSAFSPASSYAPPGGGNFAPPGGGNIDAAEPPADLSERSGT